MYDSETMANPGYSDSYAQARSYDTTTPDGRVKVNNNFVQDQPPLPQGVQGFGMELGFAIPGLNDPPKAAAKVDAKVAPNVGSGNDDGGLPSELGLGGPPAAEAAPVD
jgi:hypothetical protein